MSRSEQYFEDREALNEVYSTIVNKMTSKNRVYNELIEQTYSELMIEMNETSTNIFGE